MPASRRAAAVVGVWCRVVGHKWALMPGISHGHDELYECRRCGAYDWRDLPAEVDAGVEVGVEAQAGTQVNAEPSRVRTRGGRPAAAPGAGRRR